MFTEMLVMLLNFGTLRVNIVGIRDFLHSWSISHFYCLLTACSN